MLWLSSEEKALGLSQQAARAKSNAILADGHDERHMRTASRKSRAKDAKRVVAEAVLSVKGPELAHLPAFCLS